MSETKRGLCPMLCGCAFDGCTCAPACPYSAHAWSQISRMQGGERAHTQGGVHAQGHAPPVSRPHAFAHAHSPHSHLCAQACTQVRGHPFAPQCTPKAQSAYRCLALLLCVELYASLYGICVGVVHLLCRTRCTYGPCWHSALSAGRQSWRKPAPQPSTGACPMGRANCSFCSSARIQVRTRACAHTPAAPGAPRQQHPIVVRGGGLLPPVSPFVLGVLHLCSTLHPAHARHPASCICAVPCLHGTLCVCHPHVFIYTCVQPNSL